MRLRIAIAACAGLGAALGCARQPCAEHCAAGHAGSEAAAPLPAAFRAFDANRDGAVELAEVPEPVRPFYALADANGDRVLQLEEFRAFLDDPGGAARQPLPENVELREGIPYAGSENPRQRLDLYLPRARAVAGPLPVIAYVHGGAWSMGSRVMARPDVAPHVATGRYAAVSIGYRLSDEAHWPAQIHDAKAGLRWIRAHAAELGLDPRRICAMGSSAGGHLAAVLGTGNEVAALSGALGPHLAEASDVQCAIDLFGPTDLTLPEPGSRRVTLSGQPSSRELLLGAPIGSQPALEREASPLHQVTRGDPPFLIIHGTRDPLVAYEDSVALARALRAAGVRVYLQTIEGGGHGDFLALPEISRRVGLFLEQTFYASKTPVPTDTLVFEPPPAALPAAAGAR